MKQELNDQMFTWAKQCVWKQSDSIDGRRGMWRWLNSMFPGHCIDLAQCSLVDHIEIKLCSREARRVAEYLNLAEGEGPTRKVGLELEERSSPGTENTAIAVIFAETGPAEPPDKWLQRISRESDPRHFPITTLFRLDKEARKLLHASEFKKLIESVRSRVEPLGAAVKEKNTDSDINWYRISILVREN